VFVAGIVVWTLLVVSGIVLVIRNLRDNVPLVVAQGCSGML